ncbi:MAG TPA: PDZ domain-containing protein, partial [Bryobacteraceae bacterium]|nr:PDZ domain-containing protein [Bryobacteraceae bacterium]
MSSTCLVALLLLGGVVSKGAPADDATTASNNVYKHLSVYSEVLSRIKSEYVEEPDMSNVTLGAMNGMLESIDPYASFLNATQYKEYLKNFDTYKGDLGMVLAKKYGYITVVSVIPGSPADKAGLTTGDFLESIKGIATRDMPLAYARLLLKGEPGTTIDMTVLRRKPEPQKLTMTRALIAYPPVES